MWVQIDNEYLNYLRDYGDGRVPFQNYGQRKFKPFFKAFKLKDTNVVYVANIGHNNPKHSHFSDSIDYKNILDAGENKVGGIHLNTMFPVPEDKIIPYTYDMIETRISFGEGFDFGRHLPRFKLYEEAVKDPIIVQNAAQIYRDKLKQIDAEYIDRTLDFSTLEAKMVEYQINEYIKDNKIELDPVEVSRDGLFFIIQSEDDIKRLNYKQISNVPEIVQDIEMEARVFELEI